MKAQSVRKRSLQFSLANLRLARGPQIVRGIRRGVQILALLFFLYLFVAATFMNPMPGLANLFYRLDPLVALTASLAGRALIAEGKAAGPKHRTFIYVNNRLEGNAISTIAAMLEPVEG